MKMTKCSKCVYWMKDYTNDSGVSWGDCRIRAAGCYGTDCDPWPRSKESHCCGEGVSHVAACKEHKAGRPPSIDISAVPALVVAKGPITAGEVHSALAADLKWSKPTAYRILDRLVSSGLLVRDGMKYSAPLEV